MRLEKKIVVKPLSCSRQQFKSMERFSELIRNISDLPKSKTFVYFIKYTAAAWTIN